MQEPTKRRPDVFWMGEPPATCQISGRAITDAFIDGAHPRRGSWACWHPDAFKEANGMLGTGRGQRYERQANGRFMRTEG